MPAVIKGTLGLHNPRTQCAVIRHRLSQITWVHKFEMCQISKSMKTESMWVMARAGWRGNVEGLLTSTSFPSEVLQRFWNYIMMGTARYWDYTKTHCVTCIKWVDLSHVSCISIKIKASAGIKCTSYDQNRHQGDKMEGYWAAEIKNEQLFQI